MVEREVEFRMRQMSDELDDLERRGLFQREEISEIARRRREFEYRVNQPEPLKQDYLDYVEYLTQVDDLRDLRKRKIIGWRSRGKKWKKSVSDWGGVYKISDVYREVTCRYWEDLDLWFRFLEFGRERDNSLVDMVLGLAVTFHSKVPSLWIYAATWEFDKKLNVTNARARMQQGIRNCPESEDLWIEYIRMELTYLNKLKAQKTVVGDDVKPVKQDSKKYRLWKEEKEDEESTPQRSMIRLQTIYQEALKAIPSSLTLQNRVLEILNTVGMALSDNLKEEVYEEEALSIISFIEIDAGASSSNPASTRPELDSDLQMDMD